MKKLNFVKIAVFVLAVFTAGCHKTPPPPPTPVPATIKMNDYSNLGISSVIINYTITPNDSKISESGVYLNIRSLLDGATKIIGDSQSGIIAFSLNNLKKNTKYYIWAYIKTDKGTSYSSMVAIWTYGLMDVDGNGYHTVVINNREWTVENLKVTHYNNGDLIPEVQDSTVWLHDTKGARCYYNNNRAKYDSVYGALYNFYVITDPRGIAPQGWHVPTLEEYAQLMIFLGNGLKAGGAMKEKGTKHWKFPNTGATNSSGFTALPGGLRGLTIQHKTVISFAGLRGYGDWWTKNKSPLLNNSYAFHLNYDNPWMNPGAFENNSAFSIRLIKNK